MKKNYQVTAKQFDVVLTLLSIAFSFYLGWSAGREKAIESLVLLGAALVVIFLAMLFSGKIVISKGGS